MRDVDVVWHCSFLKPNAEKYICVSFRIFGLCYKFVSCISMLMTVYVEYVSDVSTMRVERFVEHVVDDANVRLY